MLLVFVSCGDNTKPKNGQPQTGESTNTTDGNDQDSVSGSKTILFFGNSLTAGMGLDPMEAFPAIIQQKLDSMELDYEIINAGLSGETTAAGKNRISWVLDQKVDIFVLELGANDGLRGIPLEETRKNLQAIIDTVRAKNSDTSIILAGMQLPPNLGQDYTAGFKDIFPHLAEKNGTGLIPFLLEDVAGIPELNQSDGIHPTAEGQKIVAENVWPMILESIGHDKSR
tara:strand:- start:161867 stop:162547 length:681 start_codon:yes stop_codon:yes gene_type:complete